MPDALTNAHYLSLPRAPHLLFVVPLLQQFSVLNKSNCSEGLRFPPAIQSTENVVATIIRILKVLGVKPTGCDVGSADSFLGI